MEKMIIFLFVLGLFLPTSINTVIGQSYPAYYFMFLDAVLLFCIWKQKKIDMKKLSIGLAVNVILWGATLFTPLPSLSMGSALGYSAICLLYCVDIKKLEIGNLGFRIFQVVNAVVLLLGFGIIFKNLTVVDFLISNYSTYYDSLMTLALALQKPVVMFSSHSVAAFYLFLFFYLNLKTYSQISSKWNLLCAVGYIVLLFYINSNTSIFFLALLTVVLIAPFFNKKRTTALMFGLIPCVVTLLLLFTLSASASQWASEQVAGIQKTLSSDANGIQGRYDAEGNMAANFNFIANNVLRPVGFGNSEELFFGDSGLVTNMLRGSVFVVVLMYAGFYLFLRDNTHSKRTAYFLFFLYLIMDVGFLSMLYFRSVFLIPFILAYLNHIEQREPKAIKQKASQKSNKYQLSPSV